MPDLLLPKGLTHTILLNKGYARLLGVFIQLDAANLSDMLLPQVLTTRRFSMVAYPRGGMIVRRNDRCHCGSGQKFKFCCSPDAPTRSNPRAGRQQFIDTGEAPIRWVIADRTATQFFADKDNRALVFSEQAAAIAIASLEDFQDAEPGDINVAGVGPTKWELLQQKIPFVEVDAEEALRLVRERIEYGKAGELLPSNPLDLNNAPQTNDAVSDGGHDRPQEKFENQ